MTDRGGALVLDASAAVELLLDSTLGRATAGHLRPDGSRPGSVAAPELLDVEVTSALARAVRAGRMTIDIADRAVEALATLPVRRLSHSLLLPHAWRLRNRVRVADAFYVACAQRLGATLLTTDARLARAPLPDVSVLLVR